MSTFEATLNILDRVVLYPLAFFVGRFLANYRDSLIERIEQRATEARVTIPPIEVPDQKPEPEEFAPLVQKYGNFRNLKQQDIEGF